EDTDLENTAWMSHKNKPKTPQFDQYEGMFFDAEHEIWSCMEDGDCVEVSLNAQYGSWENYAAKGCLLVYTRWSP
ncbi:hypothetical protein BDV93DRAFT_421962, partial [Ceratobasidium sp. AG-I]